MIVYVGKKRKLALSWKKAIRYSNGVSSNTGVNEDDTHAHEA